MDWMKAAELMSPTRLVPVNSIVALLKNTWSHFEASSLSAPSPM
jgi:hypothetical protein